MQRFPSTLFQRVVLSLLVGLWSVLSAAQGCPELKAEDFTVDYYAANADCHTDGQIIVTYRNNVTGFSKLTYETSTNGTSWGSSVEQTSLSVPTTIPLTGWTAGQTIHLRVTATCASGTSTVTFPTQVHRSEMPHAVKPSIETTPAGGCSATAGSIGVSVGSVTGFTKAEYRLYQGTTLLNTITSNTPYAQSNFYNLPSGTYKVVMRATPACPPASPTPAFKNGAYEVEQTVKVGYFSILPSPIPTRGTCNGGVRVAVARVMGVNSIKYELLPAGGHAAHAAALQTQQLTFPNFTHTFLGIPLGSYEIRATTDCGTIEVQPFSVTTGAAGTLTTKVVRNTYVGCNKGIITGMIPGTTDACPVNYTLTPKSYAGTPIVKNGITTESVTFDNLPAGYYEMEASWGGQVQKHIDLIHTVSLGDLELSATPADYTCDPSGTITVKLKNGVYEEPMTLTLSLDGAPVRSVTLAATDREKTISNLVPGGYDISLKSECGNELKGKISILYKNMPPLNFEFQPWNAFEYDECEDMPYLTFYENTGAHTSSTAYKKFMQGATYGLYIDGVLVSSGALPQPENKWGRNVYKFPTQKTIGKFELRLYPPCGSPMFKYAMETVAGTFGAFEKPKILVTLLASSTSCDPTGEIRVYYVGQNGGNAPLNDKYTYTLNIFNTDTGNTVFTKTYTNASYLPGEEIKKLPAGHYSYEFYPACRVNNKLKGTFEINALAGGDQYNKVINVSAACNGKGKIELRFNDGYSSTPGVTYKYRLVNSAGVEVAKRETTKRNITLSNLTPDTYTLYVSMESASCTDPEVAFDPVTVPAGIPKDAFYFSQSNNKAGNFCTNTGEVTITLTPRTAGQYYVTSGTLHLIDSQTNTDVVTPIPMTDLTKPVTFTGVKPGEYIPVLETSCGKISGSNISVWADNNTLPQNLVKTQVVNIFPGCQKGKVKVLADPLGLGLPDLPTKIELIQMAMEQQPKVVDSIKSSSVITNHTFDDVAEGQYMVRYTYCGMTFSTNVQVKQVTTVSLTANAQTPGPCETGTVTVYPNPMDATIELELKVKNKLTGIVEKSITANGGDIQKITDLMPGKNYEISADIKGSCVQTTAKVDVQIPNANIQVGYNYSYRLDCFKNGWIEMWMQPGSTGRINKVQYTIQPAAGGTPTVAQTTDPTEHKKFLGLSPGKYTVQAIATCQFADGTISQYTWNNNGNPIELQAGYIAMTAYQNDTKMRSTMACPAVGAIGLSIRNGNSRSRRVFIQKDPSGPVSPEREIFPLPGEDTWEKSDVSWGGDFAPGQYKIRINDGCMDILRDITVPLVGDLMTFKEVGCVSTTSTCKMAIGVTFDLSAYPNNHLRCNLPNSYEIAVVPRGGDRTTEPWSSVWRTGSWPSPQICNTATVVDSFATIPYGNTADVLLRLKGCPSTVRRYPITLKPCCQFDIRFRRLDCDRNQYYLYNKEICNEWDVVIKKHPWSGPETEVYRKRMRFSGGMNEEYTDKDWIVPSTELHTNYYMYIYPAGSGQYLCSGWAYPFSKNITLKYVVEPMSTSCTWERYTWQAYSECPVKVKFKIWDVATNTVVDESPGLMSEYKSNYHYVRNRKYHIRLYDAMGNLVNFRPEGGGTDVSLWEHIVKYETPVNYKQPDITLYNSCDDYKKTWSLPTDNRYNCEGIPAVYAAGVAKDRGRLPIINKIEIRHNNGNVYYTDEPIWNQIWRMDNYHCKENRVMGKSWKLRKTDGSVQEVSALPVGNYTLTVYEDCGPKTSTFKVNYLPPATINLNHTVTMDCQGKFTIKPTGNAYFPDRAETMTITGFERNRGDDPAGTRYTWGQSYDSYNPIQNLDIYLKPQNSSECYVRYRFDLSRYYLSFDAASSASYFCTGSNTGDISISLKGGNPPYTYKLLKPDGTLVDQKTASGGVNFKTGKLGEIYRIDATDNCGLTHIYQDVLLQDPKEIGYTMDRDYYFCEGEPSSFEAINLAGATYEWTGPNGFTSNNRVVNITATTATAGTYTLKVKPQTCSTTINATVKINVVKVKEVGTSVEKRLCSGQTANINIGPATALSNGVPATNYKYQWQLSENPTDPNSWSGIVGATSEQLNYTPPFQGTYYVRRVTLLGNCSDYSAVSKIVADPGLTSIVSNDELYITIDHKNPFTLTAGFVTGNPTRTYQWQRSLNKTTWTNIAGATDQTYTETQRYGSIVYYKRITSAGTCSTESPIITVRFKKRYPAMVNPHLRQRVLTE